MGINNKVAFLGCGEYPIQGAINVDIRKLPGVDIISDARKLPFKNNELDGIASRNLIEHFSRADIAPMIKEWKRCIKKGGFIQIETVEAGALMDIWRSIPEENLLDGLLGAQTYNENFHKMIFTEESLRKYLEGMEIVKCEVFEHRQIPRIKISAIKI